MWPGVKLKSPQSGFVVSANREWTRSARFDDCAATATANPRRISRLGQEDSTSDGCCSGPHPVAAQMWTAFSGRHRFSDRSRLYRHRGLAPFVFPLGFRFGDPLTLPLQHDLGFPSGHTAQDGQHELAGSPPIERTVKPMPRRDRSASIDRSSAVDLANRSGCVTTGRPPSE